MNARFLEAARGDLREAVRYYEAQRPGLGREFRAEVRAAVDRIVALPEGWQLLDANVRRCRMRRFPYGVFYYVRDDEVLILAVAHLQREPTHWRDRLPN